MDLDRLTRGQRAFITAYLDHGDIAKAEKQASIAPRYGYEVLARPDVQAEMARRQLARVTSELLPKALDTLAEIMRNTKAPAAARVQAAKIVVDRALPALESGNGKDMSDMSPTELAQIVAGLERELAGRAKDVTPTSDPDVFD